MLHGHNIMTFKCSTHQNNVKEVFFTFFKQVGLNAWEYQEGMGQESRFIYLWNSRKPPGHWVYCQGARQQFQYSVPRNFQHVETRFGHFQPHYTKVEYKLKPTTGPQTCQATKILNKCSNNTQLSNDSFANRPIKSGDKQNKSIWMHETVNIYVFYYMQEYCSRTYTSFFIPYQWSIYTVIHSYWALIIPSAVSWKG